MSPQPVRTRPLPADNRRRERPPSRLRLEIQLLRALAVLAVVGNHLAPGRVTGGYLGVDIFFVISGYLITSHLVRELDRTGRLGVRRFWARRARRLLPASLLVLLSALVASIAAIPANLWASVFRQITASALYVQNWALATDAQDYFASSESPSPVTHYWSLSLEEQFYLLWPLLALAAYAVGRRTGRPKATLAVVFGVVVAASLAYSIHDTAVSPSTAYFVTPARMWQLGAGALLALAPPLRRCRHLVALAGWVTLFGSIALFTEGAPVPGWIAGIPVLGAAAVIWAGDAFVRTVPWVLGPLLGAGTWVGGISYSLYLWHWPPVVLLPYVLGHALTTADKLVLLGVVVVVAWLSQRYVEDPVRRFDWFHAGRAWRTFVPAAAAMVAVVLVGQTATAAVAGRAARVTHELDREVASGAPCFGARAIADHCGHPHRLSWHDATLLNRENYQDPTPAASEECMQEPMDAGIRTCDFGVPRSQATHTMALVGDSHARQWVPALDELAGKRHWHVVLMAKGSCPVNTAPVRTQNFAQYLPSCEQWNRRVSHRILHDDRIDTVLTSSFSRNYVVDGVDSSTASRATQRVMAHGFAETWRTWAAAGKNVAVLADPPWLQHGDIPTCVAEDQQDDDPCSTSADQAASTDPMARGVHEVDDRHVSLVSLKHFFCEHDTCHAVIGGVVAYGDENHLIGYFARTLAPYLDEKLEPALT